MGEANKADFEKAKVRGEFQGRIIDGPNRQMICEALKYPNGTLIFLCQLQQVIDIPGCSGQGGGFYPASAVFEMKLEMSVTSAVVEGELWQFKGQLVSLSRRALMAGFSLGELSEDQAPTGPTLLISVQNYHPWDQDLDQPDAAGRGYLTARVITHLYETGDQTGLGRTKKRSRKRAGPKAAD